MSSLPGYRGKGLKKKKRIMDVEGKEERPENTDRIKGWN